MSAFEVTQADVLTVLMNNRSNIKDTSQRNLDAYAENLFEEHILMEAPRVEDAALASGNSIGNQTDGAHEEIRQILVENEVLTEKT
ncbi:MAG: hypothetical protein Q7S87_01085 [Agitococcus sp.]|nr:hypothetical protein [Agitococcus sp.]MDO9179121.1 hypothetical protein [Agitococcus sp.]